MQRLFFSLKFTPEQQQQLLHYQQHALRAFPDSKAVSVDNLHLTLFFIGQVTEQQKARLVSAAAHIQLPAFTLTLDHLALFTKPRIVYLAPSVLPPQLVQLQLQLADICIAEGFHSLHQQYRPHVTLLRHTKLKELTENGRVDKNQAKVDELQIKIERFALYQSNQQYECLRYLPLAEFPLRFV